MDEAELTAFLHAEFPQVAGELTVASAVPVALSLMPADRHLRPGGTVSGPTLFLLADVAAYLAVLARIGPQALAVTTGASVDFLRKPAPGALLTARTTVLKLGRRLAVIDVAVASAGVDGPVMRATSTWSIPPAR